MSTLTIVRDEREDPEWGMMILRCEHCGDMYILQVVDNKVINVDIFPSLGGMAGLLPECGDHEIPEGVPLDAKLIIFAEALSDDLA